MTHPIKAAGAAARGTPHRMRTPATRPSAWPIDGAGGRTARADPRWPHLAAALVDLRLRGRRAVRIVDADCACGALLIAAARHARRLGFIAVEGRGIHGSATMIGRARAAAGRLVDPGIGLIFDVADMVPALASEADFPADIVLCHHARGDARRTAVPALVAAGRRVIAEPAPRGHEGMQA